MLTLLCFVRLSTEFYACPVCCVVDNFKGTLNGRAREKNGFLLTKFVSSFVLASHKRNVMQI